MRPALRIVDTVRGNAATWFAANAEGCITLAIGGVALCEVTPVAIGADGVVQTWEAFTLRFWRERIVEPGPLAEVAAAAAKWFRVAPPETAFLAGFAAPLFPPAPAAPDHSALLSRFADWLEIALDEPLATLPGADPGGGPPLELRLAHYRPDLAERAAALLEEVGR